MLCFKQVFHINTILREIFIVIIHVVPNNIIHEGVGIELTSLQNMKFTKWKFILPTRFYFIFYLFKSRGIHKYINTVRVTKIECQIKWCNINIKINDCRNAFCTRCKRVIFRRLRLPTVADDDSLRDRCVYRFLSFFESKRFMA